MEEQPGCGIKHNDMYTQDKITKGGEIASTGRFDRDGRPFYIFIAPKAENVNSVSIVTARPVYNDSDMPFPLTAGVWNPVVFSEVELTENDLSNYRIFWGEEGV